MAEAVRVESLLRRLPAMLRSGAASLARGHGGRHRIAPKRRISPITTLSARAVRRLLDRLDCDDRGVSRRTGKPSWPESWDLALDLVRHIGGEFYLVLVIASWLERQAPTTRRTYYYQARQILRELRAIRVRDIATLPHEAGLTWQREYARGLAPSGHQRLPRSVNTSTAALNSLCHHVVALGIVPSAHWSSVPPVKVTRGRHEDEDAVVLTSEQLVDFLTGAAKRGRVVLLAMVLTFLHGLRRSELAGLRVRDVKRRRRGERPAPSVLRIVGKGNRSRMVQLHPSIRNYVEAHCAGRDPDAHVITREDGSAVSPATVSWWVKSIMAAAGLKGYAHALRATWTTMALESKSNDALQVQQSGGWRNPETMLGHYFKRRQVPLIRLTPGQGRY